MACNKNVQELDSEKVAKAGDTMTGVLAFIAGTASAPGIAASGDTDTGIFFPAADTIGFSTGGSEKARVNSLGQVLIGTELTGDGDKVRVSSASSGIRGLQLETTAIGTVSAPFLSWKDGDGNAYRMRMSGAHLTIGTGFFTERLRFTSGGNLLINTTTDDGSNKLQINGNGIRISTAQTPATAGAAGTAGTFAWDSTYFYICTATNTWQRVQHATW